MIAIEQRYSYSSSCTRCPLSPETHLSKQMRIKCSFHTDKSGESVITFVGSKGMTADAGAQSAVKCTYQKPENRFTQHYSDTVHLFYCKTGQWSISSLSISAANCLRVQHLIEKAVDG